TSIWLLRRFTSTGTALMSGARSNSDATDESVRYLRPAGTCAGIGTWPLAVASAKPHSPNDGTSAWYGRTVNPAASIERTTHQNDRRATSGDVLCTATTAFSARRSRRSR